MSILANMLVYVKSRLAANGSTTPIVNWHDHLVTEAAKLNN